MTQTKIRKRSVIISALLTLVAVMGMTTATAAPANASNYVTISKTAVPVSWSPPSDAPCDNIYRDAVVIGKACFAHYGDNIWLRDMKADGAGIYVTGTTQPTEKGFKCYNDGGADAGWQQCRFADEMAESPNFLWFCGWARKDGDNDWGWGPCAWARTYDALSGSQLSIANRHRFQCQRHAASHHCIPEQGNHRIAPSIVPCR